MTATKFRLRRTVWAAPSTTMSSNSSTSGTVGATPEHDAEPGVQLVVGARQPDDILGPGSEGAQAILGREPVADEHERRRADDPDPLADGHAEVDVLGCHSDDNGVGAVDVNRLVDVEVVVGEDHPVAEGPQLGAERGADGARRRPRGGACRPVSASCAQPSCHQPVPTRRGHHHAQ